MLRVDVDKIKELELRLENCFTSLKVVTRQRDEANRLAASRRTIGNYYANRYHATRVELIVSRLMMKDMDSIIKQLTEGKQPPEITLGPDEGGVV
jgi:hypothetical protein